MLANKFAPASSCDVLRHASWLLCAWLVWGVATPGYANTDQLKREAIAMERARDCEGAYKKYEELLTQSASLKGRRGRSMRAFIKTKMAKLKPCYDKCVPTPEEEELLKKVQGLQEKGQNRRAYRILVRVLRGKNPRCSSWKQGHEMRVALVAKLPRRLRSAKQIDPCKMEDNTKQDLQKLNTDVQDLQKKTIAAGETLKMPSPPRPPRWARRSERKKRWWLRRWKRRMRWKMRRKRERNQLKRLRQSLALFQKINTIREKVFNWREEFQDCDQVYTALKGQSRQLKNSQQKAHKVIVDVYETRIKTVRGKMRWFARRYRRLRKNQKTDQASIRSLRRALEQQREMLDSVTQDLISLSHLLVFKTSKDKEGGLLNNTAGSLQKLMMNQNKLFSAMQKNYPQYLSSAQGRKNLRKHLSTLERFEKVLERFQGQQGASKKVGQTLQAVRASILVLEKAEEKLLSKPVTKDPTSAASAVAVDGGSQPNKRSPWGWVLLFSGLCLGGVAIFFILREQKKRKSFEEF